MGAEIIIKNAPQLMQTARSLLGKLLQADTAVVNTVETATTKAVALSSTETLAKTAADAGLSQSVFGAGQLPELKEFIAGLNGQATSVEKKILGQIEGMMEQGTRVTSENKKELEEILKKFAFPDEVANASAPGQGAAEAAALTQDPEKIVLDNLLGIIKAKVENPNGHIHNLQKALDFVGYKFNVTDYIADKVLTPDFENCLRACIKGDEPAPGLLKGFWQKQAFNHCRKLMNYLGENPDKILKKGPQAAYWMRYTSGPIMLFLNRIPIIGKLLCFAFPFATDIVGATGEEAVRKRLETIAAVIAKNKTSKQEVPPVASSSGPAG